ncbi:MAG: hypothetical protein IJX28_00410 [Clostridia bacterium]|nr:hypothetical protein [Clostridia bacterium]
MKFFVKHRMLPLLLCLCLTVGLMQAWCLSFAAEETAEVQPLVCIGNGFMVALANDGSAYAWGTNTDGMLGNGTTTGSALPTAVTMPSGVIFTTLSVGWDHAVALGSDGAIYTWGANGYGQLGLGDTTRRTVPTKVALTTAKPVVSVAAGNCFTLALTADGTVYAWGNNSQGQLGVLPETLAQSTVPMCIEDLSGIFATSIHAGNTNGAVITADGTAWLWGNNEYNQVGATGKSVKVPTQKNGTYFAGDIALGDWHTTMAELGGSVKSFGTNKNGQFGNAETKDTGTTVLKPALLPDGVLGKTVAAGTAHTVVLTSEGAVFAFGLNTTGQLGVTISGNYINEPQQVTVPMKSTDVAIGIDARLNNTAVIDSSGFVWTWGDNTYGQLGNQSTTQANAPVSVVDSDGDGKFCLGKAPKSEVYSVTITAHATVPAPSYFLNIPATIAIEGLQQKAVDDESRMSVTALTIDVTDVAALFGEKLIVIKVTTENGAFELADGDYRLNYAVYNSPTATQALTPGDVFAEFATNGSASGRIEIDQSQITRTGNYTGTLLFDISVRDIELSTD